MPYQYTYFNEARRPLLAAGNTDTDHWQMSLGELYALTSRRSRLFPDAEDGPLYDTRESLGIVSPSSDETRKSRLRAGAAAMNPGKERDKSCQKISDVRRHYPITGETIIFHSVEECDK
jgi:hypothetical protein